MNLSAHFTAEEVGWERIPSDLRPNALATLALLEELRAVVGAPLRVTSLYRSPADNARAGGAAGSQHLDATAADVVPVGIEYANAWERARDAMGFRQRVGQLIGYAGGSHLHVSLPTRGARGDVLWATKSEAGATSYARVGGDPSPVAALANALPVPTSPLAALFLVAGVLVFSE